MSNAIEVAKKLVEGVSRVIKGRDDTIKLVVAALLADGHVLIEDYPGSGKTTLTKALGHLIARDAESPEHIQAFRRIQFTPDLLPGDVLGVNVFEPKSGTFRFHHGPVFAHILLADEINRTGPKVQSAFLECMAEKQVTIDNLSHKLDDLFFVIGTQNPLDIAGTYPLPIVQLDRFLLKIPMSYVDKSTELLILEQHNAIVETAEHLTPVCTRSEVLDARKQVSQLHISAAIRETIVDIVQSTRRHELVQFGASTRAALMAQAALRAWAVVQGRDFVTEDDLSFLLPFVLCHRMKFFGSAKENPQALRQIAEPHLEKLISSR